MAGTGKSTMQGLGCPVSAVGQGEQAGPQSSSSSDRSSLLVGDLANKEYDATRRIEDAASHFCGTDKNIFCYVCGKYEVSKYRRSMNKKCTDIYEKCYKKELSVQNSTFAPETICCSCFNMLIRWDKTRNDKILKYTSPVIWSIPESEKDCYFCNTNVKGFNVKTKSQISYALVSSVVPAKSRVECADEKMDTSPSMNEASTSKETDREEWFDSVEESLDSSDQDDHEEEYVPKLREEKNKPVKLFNQESLSNFIRDMGLPKDASEYMAAVLKNRGMLERGTKSSVYRNREKQFRQYFKKDEEGTLVYCTDVLGLMNEMKEGIYVPEEWRLFIDSSKRSLKAVLLNNGNGYASLPLAHSTQLKESYENVEYVLDKIRYKEHNWQICGDLKIITILLGQQSGFTKYPCFLCLWDSRDRENHYVKKNWQSRAQLVPGSYNILKLPLIDPSKVLLPPLHIKLGLMKQFVKALDKGEKCFKYLVERFPRLSEAKLKEGIFDGPQIRKMFNDEKFIDTMNDLEKAAWLSFRDVCQNFLGNNKSDDYKTIVANMIRNYKCLGCLMSHKVHFMDAHLSYFPDNLGDYSEEQGERFHQDLKEAETRWQGKWDVNMLADYCWLLKRDRVSDDEEDDESAKRIRNPLHRSFESKRKRYRRINNS